MMNVVMIRVSILQQQTKKIILLPNNSSPNKYFNFKFGRKDRNYVEYSDDEMLFSFHWLTKHGTLRLCLSVFAKLIVIRL